MFVCFVCFFVCFFVCLFVVCLLACPFPFVVIVVVVNATPGVIGPCFDENIQFPWGLL